MANLFALTIPDDPDALLVTYEAGALIRVQSSPTSTGSYANVTTIAIVSGQTVYPVYDATGGAGYWYKYRYEAADTTPTGSYSAVFQPIPGSHLYATRVDLKRALGYSDPTAVDAINDPQIDLAIAAASDAITSSCQRFFSEPTGVTESRYFRLSGYIPPTIDFDDLVDGTDLVLALDDGSGTYPNTIATAYDLTPLDAPQRGFPYTGLAFRTYMVVPGWRLNGPIVKVTSPRWGWPATPAAVNQACVIQAARLFKRKDSPFGVAGSPAEGNVLRLLAKLDPDVAMLIGGDLERYPGFVG